MAKDSKVKIKSIEITPNYNNITKRNNRFKYRMKGGEEMKEIILEDGIYTIDGILSEKDIIGSGSTKNARVRVYATNYNVLRIMSGMGGLAYSN